MKKEDPGGFEGDLSGWHRVEFLNELLVHHTTKERMSLMRIIECFPSSLFCRENAGELIFDPRAQLEQVVDNFLNFVTVQRIDVQGGFFRFGDEFRVGQGSGEGASRETKGKPISTRRERH